MTWKQAIQHPEYQKHLIYTLLLLILCATAAPYLFAFIEDRPGFRLPDPVLELLTPRDYSNLIFSLLYGQIILGIILLARSPLRLLLGLQAYLLLTAMRFVTLLLTPLESPIELQLLQDPFVFEFFYRQAITRDLFFSGHAGTLFLLFFLFHKYILWKSVFLIGALLISYLLLAQHVHYTIDVIAAPVFAWLAHRLALRFSSRYCAPE
jgi:membrane-associated phospholipid phosphatase